MKLNVIDYFKFNESNYFNNNEDFLMYVPTLKRFWVVRPELYNGAWYAENYKLTSVLTCKFSDFYHLDLGFGQIVKSLTPDNIGIITHQGFNFKKTEFKNMPYFWHNVNNIFKI